MPLGQNLALRRSPTGHLELDSSLEKIVGAREVEQSMQIRLLKRLREDPTDPNIGMNWKEIIRHGSNDLLRGMIFKALRFEKRIASIDDVEVFRDEERGDRENRVVRVNIECTLLSGDRITPTLAFGV
jgi:hypothetical protein